jgi:hypothetical protein
MLIIRGDQVINLDNVISFIKYEDPKINSFSIEFSIPAGRQITAVFEYDNKKDRDMDYLKIIEAYNHSYRIVDL